MKFQQSIKIGIAVIIGLTLISMGIVAAQDTATPSPTPAIPTGTPSPVDLTCDPAALLKQQSDLAAQLQALKLDTSDDAGNSLDKLFKVGAAYQELALNCGYIPADAASRTVGNDVARILKTLDAVYGDPINGQVLYNGDLGCAGCHLGDKPIGPPTTGTYTRIEDERLKDPLLADYTPEQYIVESIVQPAHYLVPNYPNVMLGNFGDRITLQDLADLIAFLESQDS
jgi:mono/diheme cytochrome c family protein